MNKCVNGEYVEMTPEEEAAFEAMRQQLAAEEEEAANATE